MKAKLNSIIMSFCAFLIAAAPPLFQATNCIGPWGEPEYPDEKDYS